MANKKISNSDWPKRTYRSKKKVLFKKFNKKGYGIV